MPTTWTADSAGITADGAFRPGPPWSWTADGSLSGYVTSPAPSELRKIVAPVAPDLTTTPIDLTTILVRWNAVYNSTTYRLYRNGVLIFTGTALLFTDTGLASGTTYSYTITSSNARAGEGPASTPTTGTTPPPPLLTRRYRGGWYVAILPSQITAGAAGGLPNPNGASLVGPVVRSSADGASGALLTQALVVRYNWNDINPSGTNHVWTRMAKEIAQAAALGVLYFPLIIVRSFNGSISGTFLSSVGGQTSGTLDTTSSAAVANGTYGVTFQNIPGTAGTQVVVRSNVVVTGTSSARTVNWNGVLPSQSLLGAVFNLPSNSPMPSDLAQYAEPYLGSNTAGGWQGWRWAPAVSARFDTTCVKIGQQFDSNPAFGGIATQETSTGGAVGGGNTVYSASGASGKIYSGQDAYQAARFVTALKGEDQSIADACPSARPMHYANQLSGNGNGSMLEDYFAYGQANGALFGPPDWVTKRAGGGLPSNVYPYLAMYANGTGLVSAPGPTFLAMQNGEWSGTGAGDPLPVSIPDLYNYATASNTYTTGGALDHRNVAGVADRSVLNVPIGVCDYHTANSGGGTFAATLVPIMQAHPTIGTFTPA